MNATLFAYNKHAKDYQIEVTDFWKNFPAVIFAQFKNILPGSNVLNVGSGPGIDSMLLKELGLNVFCLDGSSEMVRITNELGFESILSDFKDFRFPDSKYDGVWAYTSLLHLEESEMIEIIKKIKVTLVTKGVFAIGMIEGDFSGEKDSFEDSSSKRYFKYYEKDYLKKLLCTLGFSCVAEFDYKPNKRNFFTQLYLAN